MQLSAAPLSVRLFGADELGAYALDYVGVAPDFRNESGFSLRFALARTGAVELRDAQAHSLQSLAVSVQALVRHTHIEKISYN